MKTRLLTAALLLLLCAPGARSETVVDQLLASYDAVRSVSCEVRKVTEGPSGEMRRLSTVHYEKPNRIHVENKITVEGVPPLERRIVSDGKQLYYYIAGDPRGFSRPVDQLDKEWLISLRKVPGTAMDHLLRLKGLPETDLDATADFPVRKGYDSGKVFAVLSLDKQGRLARIEFFGSAKMERQTGRYDFENFTEVGDGIWIPRLHKALAVLAGTETKETTRIDNLIVNQPVAKELFEAEKYFDGVEFVDSFEKVYE